jgi:hypothetical protein
MHGHSNTLRVMSKAVPSKLLMSKRFFSRARSVAVISRTKTANFACIV